jgi:L-cysteine S-thiosulfotransferase
VNIRLRIALVAASLFAVSSVLAGGPRSGYEFIQDDARRIQDDDFGNPAMLTDEAGRERFVSTADNGKSCASCHGDGGSRFNLSNIAAYPRYSTELTRPVTLQQQINICWTERMDEFPLIYDSQPAVELETYVRHLARGQTIQVQTDGPMALYYEAGRVLYNTRVGQLDMACTSCHDHHSNQKLRGQVLSQGQSNGFPLYRLNTGHTTTLHQRFRECYASFRADPFEPGSNEFVNLELYVNARGNGLRVETPAVRH